MKKTPYTDYKVSFDFLVRQGWTLDRAVREGNGKTPKELIELLKPLNLHLMVDALVKKGINWSKDNTLSDRKYNSRVLLDAWIAGFITEEKFQEFISKKRW